jgi:hypothetical protein
MLMIAGIKFSRKHKPKKLRKDYPKAGITFLYMNLIQIFLPIYNEQGEKFPSELYKDLIKKFSKIFGGATLYKRAPADGFWEEDTETIVKDELAIFEVMVKGVDEQYWSDQKQQLELAFKQKEILIRSIPIKLL